METNICFSCEHCHTQGCRAGDAGSYPQFCPTKALESDDNDKMVKKIRGSRKISKMLKTSAEIEGLFYGQKCRVEELLEYYRRTGAKKIGIATCMGLIHETRLLCKILDKAGVQYYTVCCKVGAIDKGDIGIPDAHKLNRKDNAELLEKGEKLPHESMCNPLKQAEILNAQHTDFNIIMGLCIGHDMAFTMHSKAPVTTLVVKDRVLCHNPVSALYGSEGMYSRFK